MNDELIVQKRDATSPEHIIGEYVEHPEGCITSFVVKKRTADGSYKVSSTVTVHHSKHDRFNSDDMSKTLRICDAFDAYINKREVLGIPDFLVAPPQLAASPELQAASDRLIEGIAKEMREFGENGPILQAIREKLGDAYISLVVDLVMSKNPDLLEIAMRNSSTDMNLARLESMRKGEENGTTGNQEI